MCEICHLAMCIVSFLPLPCPPTHQPYLPTCFYRPQMKFEAMLCFYTCLSFCSRGVYLSMQWDRHPLGRNPLGRHLPWADIPPGQTPPWQTPQTNTPTPSDTTGYGQQEGGTHPTGMHSCCFCNCRSYR